MLRCQSPDSEPRPTTTTKAVPSAPSTSPIVACVARSDRSAADLSPGDPAGDQRERARDPEEQYGAQPEDRRRDRPTDTRGGAGVDGAAGAGGGSPMFMAGSYAAGRAGPEEVYDRPPSTRTEPSASESEFLDAMSIDVRQVASSSWELASRPTLRASWCTTTCSTSSGTASGRTNSPRSSTGPVHRADPGRSSARPTASVRAG